MEREPMYNLDSYTDVNEMPPGCDTSHGIVQTTQFSQYLESSDEQHSSQYEYVHEPLNPWIFNPAPGGDHASTSSSIVASKDVGTPGGTNCVNLYDMTGQSVGDCQQVAMNYNPSATSYEQNWLSNGANTWPAQQWLSTTDPHCLHSSVAMGLDPNSSSYTHIERPIPTQVSANRQSNDDLGETSEDNDDESEVSDYYESDSGNSNSNGPKFVGTPGVQKHGKWGKSQQPYTVSQPRNYSCTLPKANGMECGHKFTRPEHLRRHEVSCGAHAGKRDHYCKVPNCTTKPFTRGDNLRDHYWTHLERGGRLGKNTKYSFQELKAMLGPKEKKLIRRLKEKLIKHRAEKLAMEHKGDGGEKSAAHPKDLLAKL